MSPLSLLRLLGVVPLVGLAFIGSARAQTRYRVLDLGGLGGSTSRGTAINDVGEILGEASSATSALDASFALNNQTASGSFFAESNGTEHALPGAGVALNSHGEVVGTQSATDACGATLRSAFVWSVRLGARTLPPLPGDLESVATAINGAGVVVGYSADASSTPHAVVWIKGQPQALGTPDGSTPIAINKQGQVLGLLAGKTKGTTYNFFLWTAATGYQPAPSLTRAGDQLSLAIALNERGQILGTSSDAKFVAHAVLWDANAGLLDIGQVAADTTSTALSLNDRGDVLAVSSAASGSAQHFFLWNSATGLRNVDVGQPVTSVAALNAHGDLVGTLANHRGAPRAFVSRGRTLRELGALGGDWSVGSALNANGDVAGYALDVTGNLHAFRWTKAHGLENLGDLDAGAGNSVATGINATGQISGTAFKTRETRHRGFVWSALTQMSDLGSLEGPGLGFTEANAINSLGQVVGFSSQTLANGNFAIPAFLWDTTNGMQPLPLPADFLTFFSAPALAINDRASVVGTGVSFSGDAGWIWDATLGSRDLLTVAGEAALPTAINALNQVVGSAPAPASICAFESSRAFITGADGLALDLGALAGDAYSTARGINARGQVVGDSGFPTTRAFLYDAGQLRNLSDLLSDHEWTLQSAEAINDAGEITGVGVHHGQVHAFLLQPLRGASH